MLLLVAILRGMLLPNERVRSHREEVIEIIGSKRPELEELAFQNRLEVEGHILKLSGIFEKLAPTWTLRPQGLWPWGRSLVCAPS